MTMHSVSRTLAAASFGLAVCSLATTPAAAQTREQATSPAHDARPIPLVVIDGVVLRPTSRAEQDALFRAIPPVAIEAIEVVRGAAAVRRFGEDGAAGAILITLKSAYVGDQVREPGRDPGEIVVRPAELTAARDPLVIVDGVIVTSAAAAALVPEAIERIEVVKGAAAAALYGERARGGVIRITTRKR